ncbi:hypothetical protein [Parvularcula marina]|uniref:hypothetical protein n=1 Tax=Parvularcula marina TaxID=2292771 RepID=UPI0035112497
MILRRLTNALRRQDWVTVVIETLIVVFGVYLGLQVNNWNEALSNTRLGEDYVRQLRRETEVNLVAAQSQTAYYNAVLESVVRTGELLRETDPDPHTLIIEAYRATEVAYLTPARATWDQIISSGHLDLLPKEAAESGLSQFYAFDTAQDIYRLGLESDYRVTVRQIIPMHMQIAMRETCSDARDAEGNVVGFMDGCDFDADATELEAVALALRSDPTVPTTLSYHYSIAVSAVLNFRGIEQLLENALAGLGSPSAGTKP